MLQNSLWYKRLIGAATVFFGPIVLHHLFPGFFGGYAIVVLLVVGVGWVFIRVKKPKGGEPTDIEDLGQ